MSVSVGVVESQLYKRPVKLRMSTRIHTGSRFYNFVTFTSDLLTPGASQCIRGSARECVPSLVLIAQFVFLLQ